MLRLRDGYTMNDQNLRSRLYDVIFEADTPAGKLFDMLLFAAIIISVGLTMLSSVRSIQQNYAKMLFSLNTAFTILFTIEYILRIYCSRRRLMYVRWTCWRCCRFISDSLFPVPHSWMSSRC